MPFGACLPAPAAEFTVTETVWGDVSMSNSFAWALDQANKTPGVDTIILAPTLGTTISVDPATPPTGTSFLGSITDSLRIEGNGVTLEGNPMFVATSGVLYDKFNVSRPVSTDILVQPAFSFAEVAAGVSVSIANLTTDGLNGFLEVGHNAVATVTDSVIKNTVFYGYGARNAIRALEGSVVNLTGVTLERINTLSEAIPGAEFAWDGAIAGSKATLNMLNSRIQGSSTSLGGVNWLGGTANVVSSIFTGDAGGLSISDEGGYEGVLNFVNSLFRPEGAGAEVARIQAIAGGVANVIASTVQINGLTTFTDNVNCEVEGDNYRCNGAPLQAFGGGAINLRESAVSAINMEFPAIDRPYSESFSTNLNGDLTAGPYTYVQPTTELSSDDLKALFNDPQLLTEGEAYALDLGGLTYFDLPEGATPQGPLIAGIPDADGSNQLLSPIDGSVIDTDVFGNPRTAYGFRDIGAVQATQVPGPIPVLGVAAAFRWSRRLRRTMLAERRR